MDAPENILDLTHAELSEALGALGAKPFRVKQVWQWLWEKGADSFDAMTNISKDFRAVLAERFVLRHPEVVRVATSRDGTVKLLLGLADGARVETVLIPEKTHYTQCLSTQVGCAMGCTFCATGSLGFSRNLTQAEILGQILVARAHAEAMDTDKRLRNLVLMGMGEPFMNTTNVMRALTTIKQQDGLLFSTRRITVSTCGLPDTLPDFQAAGVGRIAISLHAPTQALREQIMPRPAKALPLDRLMDDLAEYARHSREYVTIEYLLLGGLNDDLHTAQELVRLLSHFRSKVNLIVYNPPANPDEDHAPVRYKKPAPEAVAAFQQHLEAKGIICVVRKSKGEDIDAACGQLAARET